VDGVIRLSTTVVVLAVAGIAAYASYRHAYAVVREYGKTGVDGPAGARHDQRISLRLQHGGLVRGAAPTPGTPTGSLAAHARHRRHARRQHGPGLVSRAGPAAASA
jgi:hypothetical protein